MEIGSHLTNQGASLRATWRTHWSYRLQPNPAARFYHTGSEKLRVWMTPFSSSMKACPRGLLKEATILPLETAGKLSGSFPIANCSPHTLHCQDTGDSDAQPPVYLTKIRGWLYSKQTGLKSYTHTKNHVNHQRWLPGCGATTQPAAYPWHLESHWMMFGEKISCL